MAWYGLQLAESLACLTLFGMAITSFLISQIGPTICEADRTDKDISFETKISLLVSFFESKNYQFYGPSIVHTPPTLPPSPHFATYFCCLTEPFLNGGRKFVAINFWNLKFTNFASDEPSESGRVGQRADNQRHQGRIQYPTEEVRFSNFEKINPKNY